jgi:hypothetical protein
VNHDDLSLECLVKTLLKHAALMVDRFHKMYTRNLRRMRPAGSR